MHTYEYAVCKVISETRFATQHEKQIKDMISNAISVILNFIRLEHQLQFTLWECSVREFYYILSTSLKHCVWEMLARFLFDDFKRRLQETRDYNQVCTMNMTTLL